MHQSSNGVGWALTAEEIFQVGGGIAPLVAAGYIVAGFGTGVTIAEIGIKVYEIAMHHLS